MVVGIWSERLFPGKGLRPGVVQGFSRFPERRETPRGPLTAVFLSANNHNRVGRARFAAPRRRSIG